MNPNFEISENFWALYTCHGGSSTCALTNGEITYL